MSDNPFFLNVIVPYINFAVFVVLLVFFTKNKFKQAFAKRRSEFEEQAKSASTRFERAEKEHLAIKKRLELLQTELAEFERRAELLSKEEAQKLTGEARAMAKNIENDVARIIQAEVDDAKQEMKSKILTQVQAEVASQLAKTLKPQDHEAYLKAQLRQITIEKGALS